MTSQPRLEKIIDMALWADFYGVLLTEKQRQALHLFYEEDFSLGEIAEACACSRQAAHDIIRRSEALLADYESKLALAARHRQLQQLLEQAGRELNALGINPEQPQAKPFWQLWQKILESV